MSWLVAVGRKGNLGDTLTLLETHHAADLTRQRVLQVTHGLDSNRVEYVKFLGPCLVREWRVTHL